MVKTKLEFWGSVRTNILEKRYRNKTNWLHYDTKWIYKHNKIDKVLSDHSLLIAKIAIESDKKSNNLILNKKRIEKKCNLGFNLYDNKNPNKYNTTLKFNQQMDLKKI